MKKAPKVILISLAVVVVLVLVVVGIVILSLNSIVKTGAEKGGTYALKVPVRLDSANISLFGGSAELKGFSVDNPPGYDQNKKAIRFGEVRASVRPGSLSEEVIEIPEVVIRQPEISVEGDLKDGSNIQKLLKNLEETVGSGGAGKPPADKPAPGGKDEGPGKKLRIGRILIEDAKVSLGATFLGGEAGSATLPKIELKDIGTGPGGATPAEVASKVLNAILLESSKASGKVGDAMKKFNDQAGVLKGLGNDVKETGKGLLDGVKGIFK
ncbi:MAG TPA: AsmA family protein [Planctomycetota bacterium]|nr:AsmA family protein [Planctomycetota bacterium]